MITRHNLAEQLREYEIRPKHEWASASFFSVATNFTSRVDIVIFVIWELIILAFLVFSAVSLYFRHMRLAFILLFITMLLLLCLKITKQVRLARKKKRRMLLPLSIHGYAEVTGNGKATDWKNARHQRKILMAVHTNCGRCLSKLLVYWNYSLSKELELHPKGAETVDRNQ